MGRETEVLANILEVNAEQRRQKTEERRIHMENLQSGQESTAIRSVRAELASNPTAARREHLEALLTESQGQGEVEASQEDE